MTSPRYPWKPAFRMSLNKLKFELTFWRPNICLKWPGFQISAFFSQGLSEKYAHGWRQKSQYYRGGFVLRVLWLGFCLRYGAVKVPSKKSLAYLFPDEPDEYEADRLMALDMGVDEADTF